MELDDRDRTIICALITHGSPGKVAETLDLSQRHTRRLLRKLERRLGVSNSHAVVALVVHAGLIAPTDMFCGS